MDIDSLVAIDVHTHVHRSVSAPPVKPEDNEHLAAMAAYFKTAAAAFTVDDLAAYYRERRMAAVTFTIDVKDQPEDPARATPEEITQRARDHHADVLIPFGSVDPTAAPTRSGWPDARSRSSASRASSSTQARRRSSPTTGWPTRSTR